MSTRKEGRPKTGDIILVRKISGLGFKHGLTQEQLAVEIGVTFNTVNSWESGKSKPSPLAMRQIEELMEHTDGKK